MLGGLAMTPVNKVGSIVTFVCAFAAFILSILCLFAGSSPSFFPAADMMSVNISQIGKTPLFGGADLSKCKRAAEAQPDIFGDIGNTVNNVVGQATNGIDCGVNQVKGGIQTAQNAIVDKLTQAANLPGFIDLHVMNFCTGQFDPKDYVAKGITDPKKDRTFCSPKATDFSFSLTDIVQKALPAGLTLADIKWPSAITDAEATLKTATRAMIIFYAAGVGAAAFVALVSLLGILISAGFVTLVVLGGSGISLFALLIASAASTIIIKKAVPQINDLGGPIGVAATEGTLFIGMTWAATLLMLIAMLVALAQRIARKRMMGMFEKTMEQF